MLEKDDEFVMVFPQWTPHTPMPFSIILSSQPAKLLLALVFLN